MTSTATKVQKTSEVVLQILEGAGLSKIFNWEDYFYFKKNTKHKRDQAQAIAELFQYWYSHEISDFADYEF